MVEVCLGRSCNFTVILFTEKLQSFAAPSFGSSGSSASSGSSRSGSSSRSSSSSGSISSSRRSSSSRSGDSVCSVLLVAVQ